MRVEFTVPMEGPRTALHPKGVSIRPGDQEEIPEADALRLIERGLAHEVDDDGYPIRVSTRQHAADRQPPVERTTERPPSTPERAVTQPQPAKPSSPRGGGGASGGKTAKA